METAAAPVEPDKSLCLVALLPPSNVARALTDLKQELYRRYGLVSALALEPLIPLAFCGAAPPEPRREPGRSSLAHGCRLSTGGLRVERGAGSTANRGGDEEAPTEPQKTAAPEGALYLDLAPADPEWLSTLRAGFPSIRGLFPIRTGVYLADLAETVFRGNPPLREESLASLPLPAPISWEVSHLVCFNLRYREERRWWGLIEQETVWSLRLRRAR